VTRARTTGVTLAGVAVGLLLAGGLLRARDAWPIPPDTTRLLYLRSGGVARRVMRPFDAVAADVYWIRAIQHYGRDRKSSRTTGRFELLEPLLDLTTTLDPHFNIAYRFGAIFLSLEPPNGPGRSDQAIALLEKGLANNPGRWQYALDIGFVHYWHTGDYRQAAHWFESAADMPNAPEWLRPLAATTLVEGGDRKGARQILGELMGSEDKYIRQAARRGLDQLRALDEIDSLQALVTAYRNKVGSNPGGWPDLVRAAGFPGVPLDPSNVPFAYDPATGRVGLSPASSLNPLPKTLK
jgi:tetratricopeptide (TPR) repeat protein